MLVIPIGTESEIPRTPIVNYAIIGLCALTHMVVGRDLGHWGDGAAFGTLGFGSTEPALYQFLTYQFLHSDIMHLLGNMLFLWVFGNSVNAKMGQIPYLLFYLGGGIFAAWGYALISDEPFRMVGASGAIAAVTTAYLALFPRDHVTVFVWLFIFIRVFSVPAMLIIGLKIILWDNILAPGFGGAGDVAVGAHMAGYFFGFAGAMGMLAVRAVPRDHFDILALFKRWNQRRAFTSAMRDPKAAARARFGSVARVPASTQEQETQEQQLDQVFALRTRIAEAIQTDDLDAATARHEELITLDSSQCLTARDQLTVARRYYSNGRFPQAAAAFDRFVGCYPNSSEVHEIRLLLGIIYARDLRQYEAALEHLDQSLGHLRDPERRDQCTHWLADVRRALGLSAPESGST